MAIKRVKKQEHEKITDANIKRVIGLLEASPPITKKEACEILGMSYNTTRLTKIIEEWKSDRDYRVSAKPKSVGDLLLMLRLLRWQRLTLMVTL